MNKKNTCQIGYVLPGLMVTIAVFSIILYGLAILVVNQYILNQRRTALQEAQTIAEAGLDYFKWQLAHAPSDYTSNTETNINYTDHAGNIVGQYIIQVTPPPAGSSTATIQSTGWTTEHPDATYTMTAKYGQASLAQYAILYDSEVWIPPGFTINGPLHSNGGIRNDGVNTSTVTSAASEYTCTHKNGGCSPPQTKPGVWGSGSGSGLWNYPVPPIDFDQISINYTELKNTAQNEGIYLPPSNAQGYQIIFNSDNTATVYKVTQANNLKGGKGNPGCEQLNQKINNKNPYNTYNLTDINLILAEDDVWVQGIATKSLSLYAVEFPLNTQNTTIWINDNLTYPAKDGSVQLGLVSQKDIIINRDISSNFEINAAMYAQTGQIIRHDYSVSCAGNPSTALRNSITIYGSIISKQQSQWNWGTTLNSGFQTGTITYDPYLRYTPPPYFPTTGTAE